MAGTDLVDKKIRIQGHGIRISEELKQRIRLEGYYPIALTWIGEDITGPVRFPVDAGTTECGYAANRARLPFRSGEL